MMSSCGKKKKSVRINPTVIRSWKKKEENEVVQTPEQSFLCNPFRDHNEACIFLQHMESTMTEQMCVLQSIVEQVDMPRRQLQPMENLCWRGCIPNYYSHGNNLYQREKLWEVRNNREQLL